MEPAALEKLVIETFARVRDRFDDHPKHGNLSLAFEIVPEQAKVVDGFIFLTVRTIVFEHVGDVQSIRDVKEQELSIVPPGASEELVPAYLEGLALGIRRVVEASSEFETWMPFDFIPWRAFRDPQRRTPEDFAACVGEKPPEPNFALDDLTGTTPIAKNADLERAIDDDPDRADAYLVYADWLTERGDPRGELIACMVQTQSAAAGQRVHALLLEHERYFSGTLSTSPQFETQLEISWAMGWFSSVRIAVDYELFEKCKDFADRALRGVMHHPSSRFLRRLTFGCIDFAGDCHFDRLYPTLVAAGPRPSLTRLFIGDTDREETEVSWTYAGDLAALRGLYPNLRALKIRAGSMQLVGALDYPKLESLVIETGGLAAETVRAIAATRFPHLCELELWFGSERYGATSTIDDIAPILGGEKLPALTRLGLRNAEFTDAICAAIVRAPILSRLHELDFSKGVMTDDGAKILLEHRDRLAHLSKVIVSENYVTEGLLADLGVPVVDELQKEPYDDQRYVSLGE